MYTITEKTFENGLVSDILKTLNTQVIVWI